MTNQASIYTERTQTQKYILIAVGFETTMPVIERIERKTALERANPVIGTVTRPKFNLKA
jgi:hypothetical protein